jgi:hypothetical protein
MAVTLRSALTRPLTAAEMDNNFKVFAPPTAYGATGDGVTDDTTALSSWASAAALKFIDNGNYLASGTPTAFSRPTLILADNAKESGTELPFITVVDPGVTFKNLPKNHVFIRQNTTYRADSVTARVDRIVNTDDGLSNPKALQVKTYKNHSNTQTEWAISGELDNYSNTVSSGECAISGVANKYGLASVFGGHFQSNDFNIFALTTDVTAIVGAEWNIQAVGLDHPTANNGLGNRRVMDIIARTNESVTDWNTAGGNDGDAEIGVGMVIRTDSLTDGYYRYGLVIDDVSQTGNPNDITTAALIQTSGAIGVHIKGANTASNLKIEPTTAGEHGLLISGSSYTKGAIGIDTDAFFTFSTDDTKKFRYSAGTDGFELWSSNNRRAYIRLNASPALFIADTQVVAARDTGWAAMTGSTNKATVYDTSTVTLAQLAGRVMALQAALTTHGLIGA